MKKLAAQALAYQYKLQIENAQAVLNTANASLNLVDKALQEIIVSNEKLKMINTMVQSAMKELKAEETEEAEEETKEKAS
tara:strand:+ start:184 stop:423 length:240 start_codon:yes stop_codon:yes gene_type:complete